MAIDLEKNYFDLSKWFAEQKSYCDWEGFADGTKCLKLVEEVMGTKPDYESEAEWELVKCLTLHMVYTRTDTYKLPTKREVYTMWEVIHELVGVRWWMRVM